MTYLFICSYKNGGGIRDLTGVYGFADRCLTTWLCAIITERSNGFDRPDVHLGRWHTTAELRPLSPIPNSGGLNIIYALLVNKILSAKVTGG